MIRYCPNCLTERPLAEFFCMGEINGAPCNWDLSGEAIRLEGWRPPRIEAEPPLPGLFAPSSCRLFCRNGHPMEEGDLICLECGAEAAGHPSLTMPEARGERIIRSIDAWLIVETLQTSGSSKERFAVRHETDGREATLTLFNTGFEPEPLVYQKLQSLPLEHVPQIFAWGRWENRFYTVSESFSGQNLADIGAVIADEAGVRHIVKELGEALDSLTEAGIRHRDLSPEVLLVRTGEPLDLVITGFGSARLSDFDLDIVAPLETNPYMAPEAIAGAVSPASDWWSLGMILLEQLTGGELFAGVHERAFAIQVITNGVSIPDTLPPLLQRLLKGLLTRDHAVRWQWREVKAWLDGQFVELPAEHAAVASAAGLVSPVSLGGRSYADPAQFALHAAEPEHWAEARELLRKGGLATWLASLAASSPENETLARAAGSFSDAGADADTGPDHRRADRRLMFLLKLLNPAMPLVMRGELLTPGWLLANPKEGYELIDSDVPQLLSGCMADDANWLLRLQTRECRIRERARSLDISLNEDALRIYSLNTSQARLTAIWGERLKAFPETDHPGAALLLERQSLTDSDCIILLSADLALFTPVQALMEEVAHLASANAVASFSHERAERLAETPRGELRRALDARLENFAYSDNTSLDQWAQEYRLKKRLPLAKMLVMLATPPEAWSTPPKQRYIQELLEHFDKKIAAAGMRGPLVRIQTGERSAGVDMMDAATERTPAAELVNRILERTPKAVAVDPMAFDRNANLAARLGRLRSKSDLYFRDTGIDGLYLGFPFLVYRPHQLMRNPRVMPVMLWPVCIEGELYSKRVRLGFDVDREEVRLNPLLGAVVGPESFTRWEEAANALLARSSLDVREAVGILSSAADMTEQEFQVLAPLERRVPIGKQHLICSAALFHATFAGQAISGELRRLAMTSAVPGAMGTVFDLYDAPKAGSSGSAPDEQPSYVVTHSDPSQEIAVQKSRSPEGLLIEGPPGTGKSQTIVNMVSQALGDKRTVLIICQKRAALEVVYKRLEAEGLSRRVIMLTDSSRERTAVIKEIRAQVEECLGGMSAPPARKKQEREELLLLIKKLEAEIDASHHALHREDPRCGYSYRSILGKLIALQGKTVPIRVPQVRALLEPLSATQLAGLLEHCAPLTNVWLAARYEDSPLHMLRLFSPDAAGLGMLQSALSAFIEAEKDRISHFQAVSCTLSHQDDAIFSEWYTAYAPRLAALSQEELARAARWLPLFKVPGHDVPAPAGDALLLELEEVVRLLAGCPLGDFSPLLSPLLAALPGGRPAALHRDSAPGRLSFLQRWAPWRIVGNMRLASLLRQAGLGDATPASKAELHKAAGLELSLRPLRHRLQTAHRKLGLEAPADGEILRLSAIARQTLETLRDAGELLKGFISLPEAALLEDAVLKANQDALGAELAQFKTAAERHAHATRSLHLLGVLAQWLTESATEQFRDAAANGKSTLEFLNALSEHLAYIDAYMVFKNRCRSLPDEAMRLFSLMRRHEAELSAVAPEEREKTFRNALQVEALSAWKERLEIQNPLLGMARDELESKITRLKEADSQLRAVNRVVLASSVDTRKLGSRSRWTDITRLTGNRAKRLREFIGEGVDIGLLELRPVWLMNPDTASRILPLTPNLFDMIMYDEASQMPVEYAVPTLYRAAEAVVSGDEKQMPPSSFFSTRIAEDDDDTPAGDDEELIPVIAEEREMQREIKDCTDMLQLARRVLPQTTLQIHYRSEYRELINFSNAAFYENQLFVPANHPPAKILREKPLRYVPVNGLYKDQTNREEAQAVVNILEEIWRSPNGRPSVGVVTFNQKQAAAIDDLIEEKILHDDAFRQDYAAETARRERGEDMSFFVKNVENVQGDERDVIIFSSTFGRDESGRFIRNFGALGHKGGERRLNVAITRARKQVVLVSSMPIKDISDMLSTQRLPMMPRDYLQVYWAYGEALSRGDFGGATTILDRITPRHSRNGLGVHGVHDTAADNSGIRYAVRTCLEREGWKVTQNGESSVFGLDFLLEDTRSGTFCMGVECDGPLHALLAKARSREIWRTEVLRRGVPYIHRISSKAWFENPEQEQAGLLKAAQRAYSKNGAGT